MWESDNCTNKRYFTHALIGAWHAWTFCTIDNLCTYRTDMLQTTFPNVFSWFLFHWSIYLKFQLPISQHWYWMFQLPISQHWYWMFQLPISQHWYWMFQLPISQHWYWMFQLPISQHWYWIDTWIHNDSVHWYIYASSGHDVLTSLCYQL